jgi:hypothetical protein
MMRSPVAVIVALAMIASTFAPSTAADLPTGTNAEALNLLNSKCSLAQASQSPAPGTSSSASPAPTPSASPSGFGPTIPAPPSAFQGPATLYAPQPSSSPQFTPPPLPTPTPSVRTTSGPIYIQRETPAPSPGANGAPTPIPTTTPHPQQTLGPGQYIVLSNNATGVNAPGEPADLDGNVNIFFADGLLVGDHAHYDGVQYFDITGHPYIRNREDDSIIYADSIRYDTFTSRAILVNSRGATTQGVDRGKFHFAAKTLRTEGSGVMHGDRASFSTCENPRGGYHVESKTLDIIPGDKAIGHNNVIYLGGVAILYLPLIVISLAENTPGTRRNTGVIPLVGYSQSQGFYVLAKIGFGTTDYYYGYYRVEEFTRLGTGLGYVAFFRRKDGKRSVDVNFYHFQSHATDIQPTGTNLQVTDQEIWSKYLRATFGINYTGSYAPDVNIPNSLTIQGSISHQTSKDSQSYTFNRQTTTDGDSSLNLGFTDQRTISPAVTQGVNLSLTNNSNSYAGVSGGNVQSIHINTVTDIKGPGETYDLTYDRTDSVSPVGIDKEPELLIRPLGQLLPNFNLIPITGTFAIGNYSEEQTVTTATSLNSGYQIFNTQRAQAALTFGPEVAHFLGSDFNASVIATQDAYATGDLKAEIQQNASFTTPLGDHVINAITYTEQNTNGPSAEPFQTFDVLSGNSNQASDLVRIFNGSAYNLTLSSDTLFKRDAQPITYQLAFMPTIKTAVMVGGSYNPGPGNGFESTTVQISTPVGYESDIQFSTNADWKNKGRLNDKNVYFRKVIGECYEVDVAYNQDLRQVTLAVQLLAFPTQRLNFGLGQSGSIVPGSLNFATAAGAAGVGGAAPIGP